MSILQEISMISKEQQELLMLLLKEEGISLANLPIIPQDRTRASFPLTFAQRRLWILNQLEPNACAYNMFGAFRFSGPLNIEMLERSFNEIIHRHQILRMVFRVVDNNPMQVLLPSLSMKLNVVDLSHQHQNFPNELPHALICEAAEAPFNLKQGPLLRVSLLKLTNSEHVLLFTMHHIISDAWSLKIIIRELNSYYQFFTTGKAISLPQLTVEYSDYAVWQQEIVKDNAFNKNLEYWIKQLDGITVLDLPTDRVRPATQTYDGSTLTFEIPTFLTKKIKKLSVTEDVSLFMFLLAAFQLLLHRYSGQDDICVGSVISNRNRSELENLVGLFSNTLILRADLSNNPSFQELLARIKNVVLGAFANQDVPFEKLVEIFNTARDLSRQPLFQVMFVYQEFSNDDFMIPDVTVHRMDIENRNSKFDLTLFIEEEIDKLKGCIEYNTNLFDAETIARYAENFVVLLENIVTDTKKQLSNLKILNQQQEHELLEWIDHSGFSKDKCLHELFESCVERNPSDIAISYHGNQISYDDLNKRSNQIAHGLIELKVQRNQPIAVMLETGIEQVASLLAINKAGGVFVCLDQVYPINRLKQILEEVKPICFISDHACLHKYDKFLREFQQEIGHQMYIVNIAANQNAAFAMSGDYYIPHDFFMSCELTNPNLNLSPSNHVYIVYTSGSTGRPKGILQANGNSSQYMEWQSNQFQIEPKKRVAQWASITYDASYSEIFGTLCFGATLCMPNPEDRVDPRAMADWLVREKINVIQLVPSFCKHVLQNIISKYPVYVEDKLKYLESVMLAGERLPIELAREWQNYFNGKTRLYNLYGPSEIVLTTQYLIGDLSPYLNSVPIGAPFAGRQILILDKYQQLCAIGVPGEIYIKSPYLTLGYYKQPTETAKAFIQNPLHNNYSDIVYKTGDRGRWLNEHEIEFLGRIDNQLKIRGSRVEMGEIEAVISSLDTVNECAVIARAYSDGTPYLVAFVSATSKLTISTLREFLTDHLPGYMIPSNFILLDELPHTISGKVDRKALATFDISNQVTIDDTAIAKSELEKTIAAIWQQVLYVNSVAVHSNFFDLGGHSLLMIQVQMLLSEKIGRNIPLVELFKFPTIKSLADYLQGEITEDNSLDSALYRSQLRTNLMRKRQQINRLNNLK